LTTPDRKDSDSNRLVRIETKLDVALEAVRDLAKRTRTLELTLAGLVATSGAIALIMNSLQ
jgi:hypothetical protein